MANLPVLLYSFSAAFSIGAFDYSYLVPAFIFSFDRPVWFVLSMLVILILFEIVLRVILERRIHRTLSSYSVCMGLDTLPEGVLFSERSGVPLLVNHKMREICTIAFGQPIMDYAYLKRRLAREDVKNGCRTESYRDGVFLHLPDNVVWDLREHEVSFHGVDVTELIAFDVTELYRGNEELRQRNERLAAVNAQIREYNRNLDSIVREREILAAKIRLHDDFGKALLAIKSYLRQTDGDRDALLEILKTPVILFGQEAETTSAEDRFSLLEEAGRAIGVAIRYDGALPKTQQDVLAVAIHECLTNTVKHASGHLLTVKSRKTGDKWTVELTNDGEPPLAPIKETGGLANLRALAESHGVTMQIEGAPKFLLRLNFQA